MMKYILIFLILLLSIAPVAAIAPTITDIFHNPYSDDAYIVWTSDVVANNRVNYSTDSGMVGATLSSWSNDTASPKILLTGLTRDTVYYYNVTSENGGDTTTSATLSFETKDNTHGFSRYFDEAFVVNDVDGWSVGQTMVSTYAETIGEYIFWTLFLTPVFVIITIRTESVVITTVLALTGAALLFPLLPPEFDIVAKVIISLAASGIIWHFFIGRR